MPTRTVRRGRPADDDAPNPRDYAEDAEEDEEEEERPRRGRGRAVRDRGGRTRQVADSDDDDDEEEEEAPRARKVVRKGWGGLKEAKENVGGYPDDFKAEGEPQIVYFIDDEPFVTYAQHWVKRSGKQSFVCLEDDCPLCDILSDRPRVLGKFNIVNLSGETPKNQVWTVGTRVASQLEGLFKQYKGLAGKYWAVSKHGKDAQTTYSINPVKERDLEEDWGIEPLTKKEIREADSKAFDEKIVQYSTRKELREIAREAVAD